MSDAMLVKLRSDAGGDTGVPLTSPVHSTILDGASTISTESHGGTSVPYAVALYGIVLHVVVLHRVVLHDMVLHGVALYRGNAVLFVVLTCARY